MPMAIATGSCRRLDRGCRWLPLDVQEARRCGSFRRQGRQAPTRLSAGSQEKAVAESETKEGSGDESIMQLFRFALPATLLYIANPIMSIVDTMLVGQQSSVELGALAPGTIVHDYTGYICTFLGVSATNLIATASAKRDDEAASEALSDGFSLAFLIGTCLLVATIFLSDPLISIMVGPSRTLAGPAASYAKIRALAWPAVLATNVAQACLLARKDPIRPLIATWIGALINLVGDYVLIHRLGWGISGAAIATVAAQMVILWSQMAQQPLPWRLRLVPFHRLRRFVQLAGPVFVTNTVKILFYGAVTLSAARLGTSEAAAHQALVRIFILLILLGEPLGQAAQTFLPRHFVRGDYFGALRTTGRLVSIALVLGLCLASGFTFVPFVASSAFTQDPSVVAAMRSIGLGLFAATVASPLINALDGVILACRRLGYLIVSTTACTACSCSLLASELCRGSLPAIWWGASTYLIGRSVIHTLFLLGPRGWLRRPSLSADEYASLR